MANYPEIGKPAPKFTAPIVGEGFDDGTVVSLKDLTGKSKVVLYFYPKDDTPGCTKQACALRDAWDEIGEKAAIYGVSTDPVEKHRKFIDKYELPFPLIADLEKQIVEDYGVWVEKSMYGNKYMGTERTTFVIDEAGKIAAVFPKVRPAEHLKKLLAALS